VIHFGIDESGNGLPQAVYVAVHSLLKEDRNIFYFPVKRRNEEIREIILEMLKDKDRGFTCSLVDKGLMTPSSLEGKTFLPSICQSLTIPVLEKLGEFDKITIDIDGSVRGADAFCIQRSLMPYATRVELKSHAKIKSKYEKIDRVKYYPQPWITAAADYLSNTLYYHNKGDLNALRSRPNFVPLRV